MRINMAEVILKARKRMSIMNDFSDILFDELALNFQLLNSTQFRQVMVKCLTLWDWLKEYIERANYHTANNLTVSYFIWTKYGY